MVSTLVPTAGASEVEQMVINATKTDRAYIEKDISGFFANGGTLLLEYDFTASEGGALGACFVQKSYNSRFFPVYYSAQNSKLWYESNGISGAGLGSITEGAVVDGARYHIEESKIIFQRVTIHSSPIVTDVGRHQ